MGEIRVIGPVVTVVEKRLEYDTKPSVIEFISNPTFIPAVCSVVKTTSFIVHPNGILSNGTDNVFVLEKPTASILKLYEPYPVVKLSLTTEGPPTAPGIKFLWPKWR